MSDRRSGRRCGEAARDAGRWSRTSTVEDDDWCRAGRASDLLPADLLSRVEGRPVRCRSSGRSCCLGAWRYCRAVPAVFVFDGDGDLNVFPSLRAAGGWLEAIDVDNGEYQAAFLHDGSIVEMGTAGETVLLTPTATRDLPRLDHLLKEYQHRVGTPINAGSALDFANHWLRAEWERRWPKRPAWLARTLHRDPPPHVEDDEP